MAKAKQGHLPDMAPETIPEIETAADAFVEARNAWQSKHAPMMEAYQILEAAMKKHKVKKYEYDSNVVEVVAGDPKVKVSKKKETVTVG